MSCLLIFPYELIIKQLSIPHTARNCLYKLVFQESKGKEQLNIPVVDALPALKCLCGIAVKTPWFICNTGRGTQLKSPCTSVPSQYRPYKFIRLAYRKFELCLKPLMWFISAIGCIILQVELTLLCSRCQKPPSLSCLLQRVRSTLMHANGESSVSLLTGSMTQCSMAMPFRWKIMRWRNRNTRLPTTVATPAVSIVSLQGRGAPEWSV